MQEEYAFHFLKLSGRIAGNKEKEFEQTIRFVYNQMSPACLEKVLSTDANQADHHHLFLLWKNEESARKFMISAEFQLIRGAFVTLGTLENTVYGTCVEKPFTQPRGLN